MSDLTATLAARDPVVGYTAPMDFSTALSFLRSGFRVRRPQWGAATYMLLGVTGETVLIHHPYFGEFPWIPSGTDVLARDWLLVQETPHGG
jgi:hypothetical protein